RLDYPRHPTSSPTRRSSDLATGTFHITVTEAAAAITTNNTLTVGEGTTGTIDSTLLVAATDPGDPAGEIVYTLIADPTRGTLFLDRKSTRLNSSHDQISYAV